MDGIHRKRLEWMAKATRGDLFPAELFSVDGSNVETDTNNWGAAVAETAQAVLKELARLELELEITIMQNNGEYEQ